MRLLKITVYAFVTIGVIIWALVLYRHVETILWLRSHGGTDYPLLHPLLFLPLAGFLIAGFFLLRGRAGPALVTAVPTLAITLLFWVSQSAARLG